MKKIYIVVFILLIGIMLSALEPIAVMIKSKGDITLIRDSKEQKITSGTALYNNDVLKSSKNSYAAIRFSDASSLVKLFPNSHITISAKKDKKKYNKNIVLKVGNVWSKVTKKTGKYVVETPTTVVSVKGTEFLVDFNDKKKITNIMTFRGVVLTKNKFDKFIKEVHPGEKTTSSGKGVMIVKKFNEKELDKNIWNFIKENKNIFEFDIHKANGEKKHIRMDFE